MLNISLQVRGLQNVTILMEERERKIKGLGKHAEYFPSIKRAAERNSSDGRTRKEDKMTWIRR